VAEPSRQAGARTIRFSNLGTLRVAAWPVETLDPFGHRELLDEASVLCQSAGPRRASFERLYAETMARERAALWARTAGDPRFMKALALANPTLMQRVHERAVAGAHKESANKRTRHLETTLYRLLARAVGRTEPFGAWCGVGFVELGAMTRIERVAPQRLVAPNLTFYVAVLEACSRRLDCARLARYRVNPTLGPDAEGNWGFWAPPGARHAGYESLAPTPQLVAAIERLIQLGSFTIPEAERALGVAPHVLDGFFFDQLASQGLLIGGFALPCFFSDPWEAIARVESDLPVPKRSAWARLRHELTEVCGVIEAEYENASSTRLAELAEHAAACAVRFGSELDFHGLPALTLHMDSSAPFKLTLGPDVVSGLLEATHADEADKMGSVRAFYESLRRVQCDLLGPNGVDIRGLSDKSLADLSQVDAWSRVSEDQYFPEWPLRTALVNLTAELVRSPQRTAVTLIDDVASLLARFFPVLSRSDSKAAGALLAWLRQAHASVEVPTLVALGAANLQAPNAGAQPDLGMPRFTLWGVTPDATSLAGARIVGLKERGLIAVSVGGAPLGALSLSAANLCADDAAMQLLLMSSFRFPAPPRPTAPVSGESVDEATRRSRVSPQRVAELASRQGIERFSAWASVVGANRGRRVVHRRDASPLWVSVDSPLAVSSLLEGVHASWGTLELREVGGAPLLHDDSGHYVSQLVLPFRAVAGD
jgi:hypothetical protein